MKRPGKRSTQTKSPDQYNRRLTPDKFLNQKEFDHLVARLHAIEHVDSRNAALIFTALFTGARASEVLEIRKTDLLPDCTVRILGLKGSNDREIPVPAWLYQMLVIESKTSDHPQLIFSIGYQRLHQIWLSYRTCNKTFHALRHTFAIRAYTKTKDIKIVQQALGHRSLMNTLIYLKYVEEKEGLRRLVDSESLTA